MEVLVRARANLRRQNTARLRSTLGKIAEGSCRRGSITVQEDEAFPDGSEGGGGGGGGGSGMRSRAMSEWTGAVESGGSAHFTSYFRSEPTNSTPKTARAVVTSPVAKTRSERKTFDGVKLSMSTEFPLSKQMMASTWSLCRPRARPRRAGEIGLRGIACSISPPYGGLPTLG